MATVRPSVIVGVFPDLDRAARAVEGLKRAGFRDDQLGLAARHDGSAGEPGGREDEGSVLGTLAAAGLGSLVGLGLKAVEVASVGPAIAGGTLALLLAGAPVEGAGRYGGYLRADLVVLTVNPDGQDDQADAVFRRLGAYDRLAETPAAITTGAGAGPVGPGQTLSY